MARLKTPSIARIGPKSNILTASRSDITITSQGDLAARHLAAALGRPWGFDHRRSATAEQNA
jgi:hypothetical protein